MSSSAGRPSSNRPGRSVTELVAYHLRRAEAPDLDVLANLLSVPAEALRALHRRCADVRYLGSWPTGEVVGAAPPAMDEATSWLERLREGRP